MSDKPCKVNINGDDYYAPCNMVDYLVVVDNRLINTYSSSITLYSDYVVYNDNTSGYPRITCPSNTTAYIRTSSGSSSYSIVNVNSFSVVTRSIGFEIYLFLVILGVLICQLFKR